MPVPQQQLAELNEALFRVTESYRRGFAQVIDPSRYAVLKTIVTADRIRPIEVAEQLDILPSSVTRHVRALADAGLVSAVGHDTDRRSSVLSPTAAGRAALRQFESVGVAASAQVLSAWTVDDLRTLTGLLGRLADDWQRAGERARRPAELGAPSDGRS
jgi:DNA-binding MarR family transcriptional regulator